MNTKKFLHLKTNENNTYQLNIHINDIITVSFNIQRKQNTQ